MNQHKTCAVVGSSSNLLNSSYGGTIDQAEAVFRMNAAPTEGFENDVGSRTDYRVGGEPSDGSAVSVRVDKSAVSAHEQDPRLLPLLFELFLALCPQSGCLVINIKQAEHLARWSNLLLAAGGNGLWRKRERRDATDFGITGDYAVRMSTGLLAVATALTLCQHVDLYGFGLGLSEEEYASRQQRAQHLDCPRSQVYARYYSLESLGLQDYCLPEPDLLVDKTHNWGLETALLNGLDSAGFLVWHQRHD